MNLAHKYQVRLKFLGHNSAFEQCNKIVALNPIDDHEQILQECLQLIKILTGAANFNVHENTDS